MNKALTYNKTTIVKYNLNYEEFDADTNTFKNTLANNTYIVPQSNGYWYNSYNSIPLPSDGTFVYLQKENPLPAVPSADYQFYFYNDPSTYYTNAYGSSFTKSFRYISFAGLWWMVTLDFAFPTPKTLVETFLDGNEKSGNTYYIVNGVAVLVNGQPVLNFTGYTNYLGWQYMVYDSALGYYKNSYAGVSGAKWMPAAYLQPSFNANVQKLSTSSIYQRWRNGGRAITDLAYYIRYKQIEKDQLTTIDFVPTAYSSYTTGMDSKLIDCELVSIDDFNADNLLGTVTNSVFNVAEQCIDLPSNIANQLEDGEYFDLIPNGIYKKNTIEKPISILPKWTSTYGGLPVAGDIFGDEDMPNQFLSVTSTDATIRLKTLGITVELQESNLRYDIRQGFVNWLPRALSPRRISQTKFGAKKIARQQINFDQYRYSNTPKTNKAPEDIYNSYDEYNYKYDQKFYDNPLDKAEVPWLASAGSGVTFNVYRRNSSAKWKTGQAVQIVPAKAPYAKAFEFYSRNENYLNFNGDKKYNYFSWLDARYVNLNANTITMQDDGYLTNWETGKKVSVYKSSNIYPGASYAVVKYIFKTNQVITIDPSTQSTYTGTILKDAGLDFTTYNTFYLSNQTNIAENGFYQGGYNPNFYGVNTGNVPYEKYYKVVPSDRDSINYSNATTFSYGSYAAAPKMPPYFSALGDSIEAWKKDLYICIVNDFTEDNNGKLTVYKKSQPWKTSPSFNMTSGALEKIELTNYQKQLLASHYSKFGYGETNYVATNYYGYWFCGSNVLASSFSKLPDGLENGGDYFLIKNGAEIAFALTFEDALAGNKVELLTLGKGAICVYGAQENDSSALTRVDLIEGEEVESLLESNKSYYLINTDHGFQLADTKEDAEDGIAITVKITPNTYLKLQKSEQESFSKKYFWNSAQTTNLEVLNDKRYQVQFANPTIYGYIGESIYYNNTAPISVEDITDGIKVSVTIGTAVDTQKSFKNRVPSGSTFTFYNNNYNYNYWYASRSDFRVYYNYSTDPVVIAQLTFNGTQPNNINRTYSSPISGGYNYGYYNFGYYAPYYGYYYGNSIWSYNLYSVVPDPSRPNVFPPAQKRITNQNTSFYPNILPTVNFSEKIINGVSLKYTLEKQAYWKYRENPLALFEGQIIDASWDYIPATYSQKNADIEAFARTILESTISDLNAMGDIEFILGYPDYSVVRDFFDNNTKTNYASSTTVMLFAKLFDYVAFIDANALNKLPLRNTFNVYFGAKKAVKLFKQTNIFPWKLILDSEVVGIGPIIEQPNYAQFTDYEKLNYPRYIYTNTYLNVKPSFLAEEYETSETIVSYGFLVTGCYLENKTDSSQSFFQLNIMAVNADKSLSTTYAQATEVNDVFGQINYSRIYKKNGNVFVSLDNDNSILPASLSINFVKKLIDTSENFTLGFTQPEQNWRKQSFTKEATNDIGGVNYDSNFNWNRISEHIDDEMITTAGGFPSSIVASYNSNKKVWTSGQLDSNGIKFKIEVVPVFSASFENYLSYDQYYNTNKYPTNGYAFYMDKGNLSFRIYASPNKYFNVPVIRNFETVYTEANQVSYRNSKYFKDGVELPNYYYGYYYGYYNNYYYNYYDQHWDKVIWQLGEPNLLKGLYTRKTQFIKNVLPTYLTDEPNKQTKFYPPENTIRDRITNNNGLELCIVEPIYTTAPQVKNDSYHIFYGVITEINNNYYRAMPWPSIKIGTNAEQLYSSDISIFANIYWKYKPTFQLITLLGVGAEVEVIYKTFIYYPRFNADFSTVFTKLATPVDAFGAGTIGYECFKIDSIKVIKGGKFYAPKNTNLNDFTSISLRDHYKWTGELINVTSYSVASPQVIYRETFEVISSLNYSPNPNSSTGFSGFTPVYGRTYSDADLAAMAKANPRPLSNYNYTKPKKGLDGMAEIPNPNCPVTISYLTKLELK